MLRILPEWMQCFAHSVCKTVTRITAVAKKTRKNFKTQVSNFSKTIRSNAKKWTVAALAAGFIAAPGAFGLDAMVNAAPQGGVVVGGQATISQAGDVTNIAQASQRAAIDWSGFDIAAHETVNFQQPNASAVALNWIVGNNPSAIYGHLNANGQVYLANPNGMYFAPGAQVNVAGLIATTSHVDPLAFMQTGAINTGERNGAINMQGSIFASGGLVEIKGATAINIGGIIKATALNGNGGAITLNNADKITINGTLDANAGTSGKGGKIEIIADKATGLLDVSGATLLAKGGSVGGDGGFIETSGMDVYGLDKAVINAGAVNGKAGTWLIDPSNFTIVDGDAAQSTTAIGAATLARSLSTNNITITTLMTGSQPGDILVNATVDYSAGAGNHDLFLSAYRNISFGTGTSAGSIKYGGSGTLTLRADNSGTGRGTLNSGATVALSGTATAKIYYNPTDYTAPTTYSNITGGGGYTAYMLVNQLGSAGDAATVKSLAAISNNWGLRNKNYALGRDIDAVVTNGWNSGAGFSPIGNFSGNFDGQGYKISGLYINSSARNVGLFDYVLVGGAIGNLNLCDAKIISHNDSIDAYVGSIAGWNNGRISNVTVSGAKINCSNKNVRVGGVAGWNAGTISGATVSSTTMSGSSLSAWVSVGGVAGYNGGTISDIKVYYATINGCSSNTYVSVGGVAGESRGTISGIVISDAIIDGSIVSRDELHVGGVVGLNFGVISSAKISRSAIDGNSSSGLVSVGGVAGWNNGRISGVTVSETTSRGSSTSGPTYVGLLTGVNLGTINEG